ncbi:hypothetical protein JG687_00006159 [Phytophthora cactorum]|uniref:Uncharacterized protein n=1 Tax=Phytophthora cactorum TaxID=29920 RepID=A0A329RTS6_9STRA|nr:hypothetical protein Pcac1_g21519 [Phytophthora cactorum]KAG2809177.1 hypothetical protein PC112_g16623 [Phytophthora cactorum]KAG2810785.1 hypothetical protein PC111_g15502 [Phytophthora cactorum]KAG2850559.1 hypothetical protein PC113_g16677 [Phytophthora cactorum]KAG2891127.1 hypothetical protein PC114_g17117 [Phytophthora cactorum]
MAPDTLVQQMPSLPTRGRTYLSRQLVQPAPPARELEAKFMATKAQDPTRPQEEDVFLSRLNKPQRKTAPSATHELRLLRADAAAMEAQLASLCAKWQENLPDPVVRETACMAAKAKWISSQAEQVNRSLKDQALQQQLYLASLQHFITQSPFLAPSRSKEVYEGMHGYSELTGTMSDSQRTSHLQSQCDLGVRLVPALMGRFTRQHLPSATFSNPFSHTSVMADGNYTFVSNILLCRIPNRSLEVAVGAALHYFQNLSTELKVHVGVQCDLEMMQDLGDARAYTQMRYRNGPNFYSTTNTTLAARITPESAVVVADFVDRDARYPIDRTSDGTVGLDSCLSLLMTSERDAVTGQEHVLVQRLSVNRYNLSPSSPRLHEEIRSTLPWFNGDLFMEVICRQLEQGSPAKALSSC